MRHCPFAQRHNLQNSRARSLSTLYSLEDHESQVKSAASTCHLVLRNDNSTQAHLHANTYKDKKKHDTILYCSTASCMPRLTSSPEYLRSGATSLQQRLCSWSNTVWRAKVTGYFAVRWSATCSGMQKKGQGGGGKEEKGREGGVLTYF